MVFRVLLITISGVAFGLHQDLEMQVGQRRESSQQRYQEALEWLESSILNATKKKYPHALIMHSSHLLSTNNTAMSRLLPQIQAVRTSDNSCKWSTKDLTFYSFTTVQMLYVTALLAWACTTYPDPSIVCLGVLYEALLIGSMLAKYTAMGHRTRLLDENLQLISSCSQVLCERDTINRTCEETLEFKINRALEHYQRDLNKARIHRKLLSIDGNTPFDELEKACSALMHEHNNRQHDESSCTILLTDEEKNKLFEAVSSCKPLEMHTLLKSYVQNKSEDLAKELAGSIYQNPQTIQFFYRAREFKNASWASSRIILWLSFVIFSNIKGSLHFSKNHKESITPSLVVGAVFSFICEIISSMSISDDDFWAIDEDKHTLATYQLYAKALSDIASQKRFLSKTLCYKRSNELLDDLEYEKQHAHLEDMLVRIKKDHANLLTRIAD